MYNNPKSRPQFAYDFILSSIITIIGFGCFAIPNDRRTEYYKIILPLEVLASVAFLGRYLRPIFLGALGIKADGDQYYVYPINVLVMQRRLCIFIMMVLGEGVIQLLLPTLNQDHLVRCYSYAFAGIVLIFSFAMLYCDAALREHVDDHAMRRSAFRGGIWIYMHSICGFFMFILGVSLKLAYHDVFLNHQIHHDVDSLTGVCCGTIVLCILILRSTHKGILNDRLATKRSVKRAFNYFSRSIFVLAHWLVAYRTFYDHSPEVYSRDRYLYFHSAITAASVIIEVCLSHWLPDEGKEKSHHHHHTSGPDQEDNDQRSRVSEITAKEDPEMKPDDIPLQELSTENSSPPSERSFSREDSMLCEPMQGVE
jgi:hypothetical protein